MTARRAVNPFDDSRLADRYESWYAGAGRTADALEKDLLGKLLGRFPGARSALEVGCGTGHFTRWMAERGLAATGLDSSVAMVREARRLGGAPEYLLGNAFSLPFCGRSYDLAAMITTLEFLSDPARALSEAVRVARRGVLLGVLNRWSLTALRRRLSGRDPWRAARFYAPYELATMVRRAAGPRHRAVFWRTTLWPIPGVADSRLPCGGFIGMAVHLQPEANP